jgi:hypothetical protein
MLKVVHKDIEPYHITIDTSGNYSVVHNGVGKDGPYSTPVKFYRSIKPCLVYIREQKLANLNITVSIDQYLRLFETITKSLEKVKLEYESNLDK